MLVAIFNGFRKKTSKRKGEAKVEINAYVKHLTSSTGYEVIPWLSATRNKLSVHPPLTWRVPRQ